MQTVKNVVLVYDAWTDGSSWSKIIFAALASVAWALAASSGGCRACRPRWKNIVLVHGRLPTVRGGRLSPIF